MRSMVVVIAALLSGCARDSGLAGPDSTDATAASGVVWRLRAVPQLVGTQGKIAAIGGGIPVIGPDSAVVMLDIATGATRWRIRDGARATRVDTAGGTVRVGDAAGLERFVNGTDGRVLWSRVARFDAPIVNAGNTVIELRPDSIVTGRAAETGVFRWSRLLPRTCAAFLTCRVVELLGVTDSTAWYTQRTLAVTGRQLLGISAGGSVVSFPLAASASVVAERATSAGVSPRGAIGWYVDSATVVAVSLADGAERWRTSLGTLSGQTGVTFLYELAAGPTGAGEELVAILGSSLSIFGVRIDATTGTVLSRFTLALDPSRATIHAGRCGDSSFGFVYTDGTSRLLNLRTGAAQNTQIDGLQSALATFVTAAYWRRTQRVGDGYLFTFSLNSQTSIGFPCSPS